MRGMRVDVRAMVNSKDLSIYMILVCGSALAVLNPMVVGIFVHPVKVHNIGPLLFCLDAFLGIIVIASILYLKTARREWFVTALCVLFLLPVLEVFAELAVIYYRITVQLAGTSQQTVEHDPELGWRPKANSDGHAREVSVGNYDVIYKLDKEQRKSIPQEEGVKNTIHFFGESFIFGQGVTNEQTAVNLLAKKLKGRLNVLNYGVVGYGIEQMLLYFRSRLRNIQRGDVVVFAPISGDLRRNFIHRAHVCTYVLYYEPDDSPSLPMWTEDGWTSVRVSDECTALEALVLNSRGLLGRLYRWWHENKVADEILVNADRVFSQAGELAKKRGASFYVVFVTHALECEGRAFEIDIAKLKTPFTSLLPYCPDDKQALRRLHFPSDYHWTSEGNRWAAHALERILRAEISKHSEARHSL